MYSETAFGNIVRKLLNLFFWPSTACEESCTFWCTSDA